MRRLNLGQRASRGTRGVTYVRIAWGTKIFCTLFVLNALILRARHRESTHCEKCTRSSYDMASDIQHASHVVSVGIFLQLAQSVNDGVLKSCFDNLVKVQSDSVQLTLYLSLTPTVANAPEVAYFTERFLRNEERIRVLHVKDEGYDIGAFLKQLQRFRHELHVHQYILKIHSKSDRIWLERAVESLCGSEHQVKSILKAFETQSTLDIISPMGTTFSSTTSKDAVFPHLKRKYFDKVDLATAFDDKTLHTMERLCAQLGLEACPYFEKYLASITAGTMFWARNSRLYTEHLPRLFESIKNELSQNYSDNNRIEHALERLIPTLSRLNGRMIGDIQPAPKPVALYFPQYHSFSENDRFWGEGFTEWTLLNKTTFFGVHKPLDFESGGLGYYNLLDKKVRARQASIARSHGVYGFCYYHYWFSGEGAPHNHKVMYQVLETMLEDQEPNLPFMLAWANEPWTKTWTGMTKSKRALLIDQKYGEEDEWREHFVYLLHFFQHPNYIRNNGKPVFAIYRTGHVKQKLRPMITLWKRMAVDSGLPGLHIVDSINHFYTSMIDEGFDVRGVVDASYHFMLGEPASMRNLPSMSGFDNIQYWGSTVRFDRRPRSGDYNFPILRTPHEFGSAYSAMIARLSTMPGREIDVGFNFICAWNEWNEQAVLEPDEWWGFQRLQEILKVVNNVPVRAVF